MLLNRVNVKQGCDAADIWAANKEFALRYTRYRKHRFGVYIAFVDGFTGAIKRLNEALNGVG